MREFFKGFALAFSMLSIIPFFKVHNFTKGINGYSVLSYPLVGFLLGSILYGIYSLLVPFVASAHLGIIIFSLWVLITGALHLDGFCDTVDGLYVSKERALEVMKDPHNGGMGMIFGGVFLLLKASTLATFESFYLLPIVMLLSRLAIVLAIYFFPYVSKSGMSTLAKEELRGWQVSLAVLYSLLIIGYFHSWMAAVTMLATLFVLKYIFIKRYGGFTGDIYGFSIEVIELLLLNMILMSSL